MTKQCLATRNSKQPHKKKKSKLIFTQITGSIFKIMETKTAPKMERKLYNLCKNHWT
jgi:hypothetical protein